MSKKQTLSCGSSRSRRAFRKRKLSAAIIVVLIGVVGTSLLAQVNSRKKGNSSSGEVSVMSISGPPSKEYIYAGSKLVATVEPTAVNGNDAQFVSMTIDPQAFGDDQNHLVSITMRNTGSTQWTSRGRLQARIAESSE